MTILLTTFEQQLRARLLDVLCAQWRELGVPFASELTASDEIIDPEALLWCSLEFLPSEPRLAEAVIGWLETSGFPLIRQRVNRHAEGTEPRADIWHALGRTTSGDPQKPAGLCHGLRSAKELASYCAGLAARVAERRQTGKAIGKAGRGPCTSLLWARNILGSDPRHFLLVYLLTNPGGGRLRDVQRWSGNVYRGISEVATRWEAARVVTIDHGYCRLVSPAPWLALLPTGTERGVVVDWFDAFESCIRLLRVLAKAEQKGLELDSAVVRSHLRETDEALSSAVLGGSGRPAAAINHLRNGLLLEAGVASV